MVKSPLCIFPLISNWGCAIFGVSQAHNSANNTPTNTGDTQMSDMMKELFDALPTNPKLMDAMVNCTIAKPRAYFPKIEKVIFNEGTVKDTGEVVKRGATVVFFEDGTRTTVRLMKGDEDNKEVALLYALLKRLYATSVDISNGEVASKDLGLKIQEVVANATYQKKVIKTKKPEPPAPPPKEEREIVKPWPKPPKIDTEIAVKKAAPAKKPAVKRTKDGKFAPKGK